MHELIHRRPSLPPRRNDGHKGTFGRVGIIGGCASDQARMIGAPALAAIGAVRSGCGLVRLACPEPTLNEALGLVPFATGIGLPVDRSGHLEASESAQCFDELAMGSDALVVGPGLGHSTGASALVLRTVIQEDAPVVLDADGINLLCAMPEFWTDVRANIVFTPHPGEARRLTEALSIRGYPAGDSEQRIAVCVALALRLGSIVILKGAGTVVSDGIRAWVCDRGHPCMATGGTGDVLAGVIGGLIAQARAIGRADLFECARAGVLAHSLAGEAWARETSAAGGMTPSELAELVPIEVDRLRAN
ncbi:MAG: NAD(P)H-hydrate dehydratase [Phycisphaerales bacterium]